MDELRRGLPAAGGQGPQPAVGRRRPGPVDEVDGPSQVAPQQAQSYRERAEGRAAGTATAFIVVVIPEPQEGGEEPDSVKAEGQLEWQAG